MGNPSQDYIEMICSLYGSSYDDRIENTAPPTAGTNSRIPREDWTPGTPAAHKSLGAFRKELKEQGIKLSTSKIKKILVTGGLWTTQQTRAIQSMFAAYISFPHSVEDKEDENGGQGMTEAEAIRRITKELEISTVSVSVSLPYSTVVYNLPEPSSNAKRCRKYKLRRQNKENGVECQTMEDDEHSGVEEKNADENRAAEELKAAGEEDWKLKLWAAVVAFEGHTFQTFGRGKRPGISFSYSVSHPGGAGGRHYDGVSVDGYGNELWVTTSPNSQEKRCTPLRGGRQATQQHGCCG